MAGQPLLPELGEDESRGEIALIYADIRATLGIPFVGLIYRTLAAEPGRLSEAWSRLRPYLSHPDIRGAAAALDPGLRGAPHIAPVIGLPEVGFDRAFAERASSTLAAYDHMNRLNLVGLTALLGAHRPASTAWRDSLEPVPPTQWAREDLLPMADLDALPDEERGLLLRISEMILPSRGPVLVPSLLRHFARPGLLRPLWRSLQPAIEGGFIASAAASLRGQAASVPIPAGIRIDPPVHAGIIETAERFVIATSTMVVTGAMLERALRGRPSPPTF